MCTSPGSAAHSKMRGKSESVSHFYWIFASFFLNTSMNMLLLECQKKHEKYNVKVGKVLNLIIYIYMYLYKKKKNQQEEGEGLCIKVAWGGREHGKPSNPGRSVNTMQ